MKELLKQKLREKSIIENRILKAHKANNYYTVNELLNDLYYIEEEIRSYKNAK